jgi:hypothetical protein
MEDNISERLDIRPIMIVNAPRGRKNYKMSRFIAIYRKFPKFFLVPFMLLLFTLKIHIIFEYD